LIIVRYIEVYNHKFLCFVRVFHPPELFRSLLVGHFRRGSPLGEFKNGKSSPFLFGRGSPLQKSYIYYQGVRTLVSGFQVHL
jgi:hypothetical protein